jgi:hypothetical protein
MTVKVNENEHGTHEQSWFEKPSSIRLMIIGLVIVCIGLVLADLFYENDHPHFPKYENFFGFQAWFGFLAFVGAVFLGKFLRLIIKRDEDYYDR